MFKDIRPDYGSTSTILTEYVRAAGIEVRPRLATALVYGIKSDTQLLGRETSRQDIAAFAYLLGRAANATGGTFNAANYSITYNNGQMTVNPAALTVTVGTQTWQSLPLQALEAVPSGGAFGRMWDAIRLGIQ